MNAAALKDIFQIGGAKKAHRFRDFFERNGASVIKTDRKMEILLKKIRQFFCLLIKAGNVLLVENDRVDRPAFFPPEREDVIGVGRSVKDFGDDVVDTKIQFLRRKILQCVLCKQDGDQNRKIGVTGFYTA